MIQNNKNLFSSPKILFLFCVGPTGLQIKAGINCEEDKGFMC